MSSWLHKDYMTLLSNCSIGSWLMVRVLPNTLHLSLQASTCILSCRTSERMMNWSRFVQLRECKAANDRHWASNLSKANSLLFISSLQCLLLPAGSIKQCTVSPREFLWPNSHVGVLWGFLMVWMFSTCRFRTAFSVFCSSLSESLHATMNPKDGTEMAMSWLTKLRQQWKDEKWVCKSTKMWRETWCRRKHWAKSSGEVLYMRFTWKIIDCHANAQWNGRICHESPFLHLLHCDLIRMSATWRRLTLLPIQKTM